MVEREDQFSFVSSREIPFPQQKSWTTQRLPKTLNYLLISQDTSWCMCLVGYTKESHTFTQSHPVSERGCHSQLVLTGWISPM